MALLIYLDLLAADKWQLHIITALKLALQHVWHLCRQKSAFHLMAFPHTFFLFFSQLFFSRFCCYLLLGTLLTSYSQNFPCLSVSFTICVDSQLFLSVYSPILSFYPSLQLGLPHFPDLCTCRYLALLLATPAFHVGLLKKKKKNTSMRSLYFPQQLCFVLQPADKAADKGEWEHI